MEVKILKRFRQDMTLSFDISVIIVNYNARNLLRRCLKSILNDDSTKKTEVVVVDNASGDGSREMIERDFPGVKLIPNKSNLGFARGANQGIRTSQGRYILLLNPDALIRTSETDKMIDFMDENKEIGICGPKMTNTEGNLQYSCRNFPTYFTSISSSQSLLFRFFPKNRLSGKYLLIQKDHQQGMEVDWVSGSALFARRNMLDKIGSLDEDFFMYVEDVDLCFRAKKGGWKVFYYPQACVQHLIGACTNRERFRMIIQHHRSMYRFYQKHYSQRLHLSALVLWGVFLRMGVVLLGQLIESLILVGPKEEKA